MQKKDTMQREDLYMLVLADRALYVWLQLLKLRSRWRPITLSPIIHDILVKMLFAQALNFRRVRSRLCQLVLAHTQTLRNQMRTSVLAFTELYIGITLNLILSWILVCSDLHLWRYSFLYQGFS